MTKIPKVCHYCFGMSSDFGGKPWSLVHFVGLSSAVREIQPDIIYFYHRFEPSGVWWELTKPLVQLVKVEAPTRIFGNPLGHPAHQADVIRLEKLIEIGGIYLDADVVVHKGFDDLLNYSTVLGIEGVGDRPRLANAIILAERDAPFLRRWYQSYESFRSLGRDRFWNEHSVLVPAMLAERYPDEIHVLPSTAFFWPLWSNADLKWIFGSLKPIPERGAYANHLWESNAWTYLNGLTPGQVRAKQTNFNLWARPFLVDLPDDFGKLSFSGRARTNLRHLNWEIFARTEFAKQRLISLTRARIRR